MRRFRRGKSSEHWRVPAIAGELRPHFLSSCQKKTAAPGQKKNASGLCTQRLTEDFSDAADQTRESLTGCAGHCADLGLLRRKPGLGWATGCRIERPLRVGPGHSASLRPTAAVDVYNLGMRVAKRNAREEKGSSFGLPPRLSPDSRDLRRKAAEKQQVLRTRQETSKSSRQGLKRPPVYPLAEPKGMQSAFFFHRARRILFRQDEKEWGVQSRDLRHVSAPKAAHYPPVMTGTKHQSANSSTTGQWSLPSTSLQMSAFLIRSRSRSDTMK